MMVTDERIDRVLQKIERYRSKKQNNIFDIFYHEDLDLMVDGLELLRKEKEKFERPKCYTPNDDPYPLCKGADTPQGIAENDCCTCCLYEDFEGDDYGI